MSILSGFKSFERYLKTDSGYQLVSERTLAKDVLFGDGSDVADNLETNYAELTNNYQSLSDSKQNTITGACTSITEDNLTASKVLISNTSGKVATSDVGSDKLTYLKNITSDVQTQINTLNTNIGKKQDSITGGASSITSSNLTTSRALVSNSSGKVAVSAVTSTELGYLDGVTSNVQTQLDNKQSTITVKTAYASDQEVANGGKIMSITVPSAGVYLVTAYIAGSTAWADNVTSENNSGYWKLGNGAGGAKLYSSFTAGYTFSFYNYTGAPATYTGSCMSIFKIS